MTTAAPNTNDSSQRIGERHAIASRSPQPAIEQHVGQLSSTPHAVSWWSISCPRTTGQCGSPW